MLKLRVILALPGWLWLMKETTELEPGHPVLVLPMLGFIFSALPIRWFPVLFPCQLALVGGTALWVPRIIGQIDWLGILFLGLAWLLNAGLYFLARSGGIEVAKGEDGELPSPSHVDFDA